ncbi:MAG: hypothetical protein ABFC34_10430 [Methanobacterium sp.]
MDAELIYICGPDGVGKSTQAKLVMESFKKKGKSYEYRWLRYHHLFSLPLLGIARLRGLSEVQTLENGEKIGYHYFYKSKIISSVYPLLLFLDSLIFSIAKLYIPRVVFKKNIVCDRFIYDTLIDLIISTHKTNLHWSLIGNNFLSLIPKNTKIVMLLAEEAELRQRRADVMQDKTLEMKMDLYRNFADKFDIYVIDASLPIDYVHKEILKKIGY